MAGEDERLVGSAHEDPTQARASPIPDELHADVRRRARARRHRLALLAPGRGLARACMTRGNTIVTTGTASGKSLCFNLPVLTCCPATRAPARSTCTRPRRSPRTRRGAVGAANAGSAARDLRRRHAARGGTAIRRRSNLVLTNPDMLHVGILPHHHLGRLPGQPGAGGRGRGAHLPRGLRLPRRERAAQAAPDRARLRHGAALRVDSATIANPRSSPRADRSRLPAIQRDGAPRSGRRS